MAQVSTKLSAPRPYRRRFDHEAAFQHWANPEGQRRTFAEVARRFGVSEQAVYKAAERGDWMERAWRIEEEARKAADRRAVKTVAQRIEEDLRLIDAGKLAVARRLHEGKVDADLGDLVALIKVEQLLVGGPSERFAGESEGYRRSLQEIEAELAELADGEVDSMLEADAIVAQRVLELPAVSGGDGDG